MNKERIIFWIAYPVIFIISKLPFSILYGASNLIYYLIYYVIGYRKKVVKKNLELCFPEKSAEERLVIEKKSFRHFVDIFIEMVKGFTMSQKEMSQHYKYLNPEVINNIAKNNNSIFIVGAHYGNWEWVINLPEKIDIDFYAIYNKVENKYFDDFVKKNRARFNSYVVQTKDSITEMIKNHREHRKSTYLLLSDQSPLLSKTHYWAPFFNKIVPVHTGAEMLSNRFKAPVVYMHVKMTKRGYYEIFFEEIKTNTEATSKYPLTDIYLKMVEEDIKKDPTIYMWTHKRFKHMGKQPKN